MSTRSLMTSTESTKHLQLKPENITAIVLCGGKGSRLNNQDKPLLQLNGKRIIDLICAILKDQVSEIVLSCSRNVAIYERFHLPLAIDEELNEGPLAGLTQAFGQVQTEWAFSTPGDTPFIAPDVVQRLYESASRLGVAVPCIDGINQNLCMLINRDQWKKLTTFHEKGGNAVKHWLEQEGIEGTNLDEISNSFFNVNTPEDLEEARSKALAG